MQTDTTAQRKRQRFGGGERGGLAGPLVDFDTLGPATLRRRGPWSPCLNHASTSPPTISFTRHTAAASTSSIEYCTAGKGGGGECVTSERLRACNPARDCERATLREIASEQGTQRFRCDATSAHFHARPNHPQRINKQTSPVVKAAQSKSVDAHPHTSLASVALAVAGSIAAMLGIRLNT